MVSASQRELSAFVESGTTKGLGNARMRGSRLLWRHLLSTVAAPDL